MKIFKSKKEIAKIHFEPMIRSVMKISVLNHISMSQSDIGSDDHQGYFYRKEMLYNIAVLIGAMNGITKMTVSKMGDDLYQELVDIYEQKGQEAYMKTIDDWYEEGKQYAGIVDSLHATLENTGHLLGANKSEHYLETFNARAEVNHAIH